LEVQISKKCTPLWREAHLEVIMLKTLGVRTTFGSSDLEKVHAVVKLSTFCSQNVKNIRGSDHFWRLRCRKSALHCEAKHFEVKMLKALGVRTTFGGSDVASLHFASLEYTTLHYTTLHYTTLHYTTLQSTTLQLHNYIPLHSATLNYTTLHYITLRYTPLHYTTLHYLPLHFTTLHYTTRHYTTTTTTTTQLHSTTLHYTK